MNEIRRTIKDFPDYKISNLGNVYSYKKDLKGKKLKPWIIETGYYVVRLRYGGKAKNITIHRLVALAFVYNDSPEEKIYINHKDENKLNNKASNLEWCTPSYNNYYGTKSARTIDSQVKSGTLKPVTAYKDGIYKKFNSYSECSRYIGCTDSLVGILAKGPFGTNKMGLKSIKGWQIVFCGDEDKINLSYKPAKHTKKDFIGVKGNNIFIFTSQMKASRSIGISQGEISGSLHNGWQAKGWHFYYLDTL